MEEQTLVRHIFFSFDKIPILFSLYFFIQSHFCIVLYRITVILGCGHSYLYFFNQQFSLTTKPRLRIRSINFILKWSTALPTNFVSGFLFVHASQITCFIHKLSIRRAKIFFYLKNIFYIFWPFWRKIKYSGIFARKQHIWAFSREIPHK